MHAPRAAPDGAQGADSAGDAAILEGTGASADIGLADAAARGGLGGGPEPTCDEKAQAVAAEPVFPPGDANPMAFEDCYEVHEELGRGAFSVVYRCSSWASGVEFAAKAIDLRPLRLRQTFTVERLRREHAILRRLDSRHIVRIEEIFETPDRLILVMEYCPGVELFDAIVAMRSCPEDVAAIIFRQCLVALGYLHHRGVIHRDLKPENVLLCRRDPNAYDGGPAYSRAAGAARAYPSVKLLDFGLSKLLDPRDGGASAHSFVGTPCYLAPEVAANAFQAPTMAYGTSADMWSAGVLLYVMLTARFPVLDHEAQKVSAAPLEEAGVSAGAQDLIQMLMRWNPCQRPTAVTALAHSWLVGATALELCASSPMFRPIAFPAMEGFCFPGPGAAARLLRDAGPAGRGAAGARDGGPDAPSPEATGRVPIHVRGTGSCAAAALEAAASLEAAAASQRAAEEAAGLGEGDADATAQDATRHPACTPLRPLLRLQNTVEQCVAAAMTGAVLSPHASAEVQRAGMQCRAAQAALAVLFRRMHQMADAVFQLVPDLALAIVEQEAALAADFFQCVRAWVHRLVADVKRVKAEHSKASEALDDASQIAATAAAQVSPKCGSWKRAKAPARRKGAAAAEGTGEADDLEPAGKRRRLDSGKPAGKRRGVKGRRTQKPFLASPELALFIHRIRVAPKVTSAAKAGVAAPPPSSSTAAKNEEDTGKHPRLSRADCLADGQSPGAPTAVSISDEELLDLFLVPGAPATSEGDGCQVEALPGNPPATAAGTVVSAAPASPTGLADGSNVGPQGMSTSSLALAGVALHRGRESVEAMEALLRQLQGFWWSMDVVVGALLLRRDHIERFISLAQAPADAEGLAERLRAYARFWKGVRTAAREGMAQWDASGTPYSFLGEGTQ